MTSSSFENVYNELTHTSGCDINGKDPMYHWDTHFPERLSQLHMTPEFASPIVRRTRKDRRARNSARFKTQPITFDEIQEVDEEIPATEDTAKLSDKHGLKTQFTAFSRSMDGLVPSLTYVKLKKLQPLTPLNVPTTGDTKNERLHDVSTDGASCESASDDAKPEIIELSNQTSIPVPNLTDSARSRRQKRLKKKQRHSRSIEEVPEIDKANDDEVVR